jgi:HK97 family phage portal protein
MNVFDIFRRKKSPAPEVRGEVCALDAISEIFGIGSGMMTGLRVNELSALSVSPIWAGIRFISEALASLPFSVYEKIEGGAQEADAHPIHKFFLGRPHPQTTRFDFFSTIIANACLGNGYARIHRNAAMRPVAIEVLPTNLVTMEWDLNGTLFYRVTGVGMDGKSVSVYVADYDMIHIKGISFNGAHGMPVLMVHEQNIKSALASQEYTKSFFTNGAQVGGILKAVNSLKPTEVQTLTDRFDAKYAGTSKVGKTVVLDNGMDYVKIGLNPHEAALIDFRKLTVEDVSRILKIPLHLLSQLDRSTFTNIEQQSLDFVVHTLTPWVKKVEEEINTKLFYAAELGRYFVRFNMDGLMRGDTDSRSKLYTSAIQNGWMTPNEVRRLENMNPIDGGDSLLIQLNMQKMETIGQEPEPVPASAAPTTDKNPTPDGSK